MRNEIEAIEPFLVIASGGPANQIFSYYIPLGTLIHSTAHYLAIHWVFLASYHVWTSCRRAYSLDCDPDFDEVHREAGTDLFRDADSIIHMLRRERFLALGSLGIRQESTDTTGHKNRFQKKSSRHRWDEKAAAAAEEFKLRRRKEPDLTLIVFCDEYMVDGKVRSDSTLYKKLTTHRGKWDPDNEFGGRRNGH